MTTLQEAAKAVVERWDSPNWKDLPHTGEFIHALRTALNGMELAHGVFYTERKLVEGVLRNMKQQNLGRHRRPRWAVITQVFGVGSGVAHGICREFGYDPEEMI